MRPAFSVIFLTTLIGVGQGLFLALVTAESYAAFGFVPETDPVSGARFMGIASAVAGLFLVAGLVSSFFHLGRPERAWRAIAGWRRSWLSREVVVLPVFMAVLALYGLAHACDVNPAVVVLPGGVPVHLTAILGVLGTFLAFTLYLCTAMIYASLRFLREWFSSVTVINFILLGGASGFMLASLLAAAWWPERAGLFVGWAFVLTLLGFVSRGASLLRNGRVKSRSTLQSAIGIKHPRIVQKALGAMGGSFNTREFFHGRSDQVMCRVRLGFLGAVFVLPAALLAIVMHGGDKMLVLPLAFFVQYVGLLAERWYFFAQAKHPQNLYYSDRL